MRFDSKGKTTFNGIEKISERTQVLKMTPSYLAAARFVINVHKSHDRHPFFFGNGIKSFAPIFY
jgi:hypothetical protein